MAKTQKKDTAQPAAAMQERGYAPLQYDVKIHSLYPEGSCRASASVNLNGSFAIRGLKVMEGTNGLFVSMPSYRTGNGEYKDICFPCTKEARSQLNEAVLHAYHQSLSQSRNQDQGNQNQGNQNQPVSDQGQAAPQMSM